MAATDSAYPHPRYNDVETGDQLFSAAPGLTKREDFAVRLMAGMLAFPGTEAGGNLYNNATRQQAAKMAVEFADALLEALGS